VVDAACRCSDGKYVRLESKTIAKKRMAKPRLPLAAALL
jgi:hypothetical protein